MSNPNASVLSCYSISSSSDPDDDVISCYSSSSSDSSRTTILRFDYSYLLTGEPSPCPTDSDCTLTPIPITRRHRSYVFPEEEEDGNMFSSNNIIAVLAHFLRKMRVLKKVPIQQAPKYHRKTRRRFRLTIL